MGRKKTEGEERKVAVNVYLPITAADSLEELGGSSFVADKILEAKAEQERPKKEEEIKEALKKTIFVCANDGTPCLPGIPCSTCGARSAADKASRLLISKMDSWFGKGKDARSLREG